MNQTHSSFTRSTVYGLILSLTSLGFASAANAGIVGTSEMIRSHDRAGQLERIDAVLMQDQVRAQLEQLGVAPEMAQERVRAMTDAELAALDERLAEMPYGGDLLAVIGVVFVVLLILELVGAIDIFKRA